MPGADLAKEEEAPDNSDEVLVQEILEKSQYHPTDQAEEADHA